MNGVNPVVVLNLRGKSYQIFNDKNFFGMNCAYISCE